MRAIRVFNVMVTQKFLYNLRSLKDEVMYIWVIFTSISLLGLLKLNVIYRIILYMTLLVCPLH